MPSRIKEFNFNGCARLKKIVLNSGVEFEGKIDLSDTPITDKNNIFKVNVVDSEAENSPIHYKDAPDGITSTPEILKRLRLKAGTPQETQTDPLDFHIEGVSLGNFDKKAVEMMKDVLFWFDVLKEEGKREYLRQRQEELKTYLTTLPARDNLNDNVRVLGENVLLVGEKILENADHFNDLEHVSPRPPSPQNKTWELFYKFLKEELISGYGLKIKPNNLIDEQIKWDLSSFNFFNCNPSGITASINLKEYIDKNLSAKALERFMNSLEATVNKDGNNYYTFPDYNEEWEFENYYNNNTKLIGFKPTEKEEGGWIFNNNYISENGILTLKKLFMYWKDVWSVK